jgi:hypothetical protein
MRLALLSSGCGESRERVVGVIGVNCGNNDRVGVGVFKPTVGEGWILPWHGDGLCMIDMAALFVSLKAILR